MVEKVNNRDDRPIEALLLVRIRLLCFRVEGRKEKGEKLLEGEVDEVDESRIE